MGTGLGLGIGIPFRRMGGGTSFQGLLDLYPNAAAAYSLRKLRAAYSGAAVRIRRSSDNAESDIGFLNNEFDSAAAQTFCGVGNGFITTWYDQSGNGLNATQTTAASQPQIVLNGTAISFNSKFSPLYDGVNDFLNGGDILDAGSNSYCSFSVVKSNTTDGSIYAKSLLGGNPSRYSLLLESNSIISLLQPISGSNQNIVSSPAYTTQKIFSIEYIANGLHKLYQNNTQIGSSITATTIGNSTYDFEIGGYNDGFGNASNNLPFSGYIQEIVIYLSDQSANRTAINTNINSYYGIY
jgi:hypothetical protein